MTNSTTRESVTFTVPTGIPDIPDGNHAGYVEHAIVHLRGQEMSFLARCMLHLERNEYPAYFSSQNSAISMDIDVIAHVKANRITYK
jgi:hypothetical protein